jgi:hypothetical protein
VYISAATYDNFKEAVDKSVGELHRKIAELDKIVGYVRELDDRITAIEGCEKLGKAMDDAIEEHIRKIDAIKRRHPDWSWSGQEEIKWHYIHQCKRLPPASKLVCPPSGIWELQRIVIPLSGLAVDVRVEKTPLPRGVEFCPYCGERLEVPDE